MDPKILTILCPNCLVTLYIMLLYLSLILFVSQEKDHACASNILSDSEVCENFYTFIILYMKTSSLISLLISLKSVGSKIKTIKLVRRGALQLILCILAYNMHVLINRTVYTVMCWDFNNRICNLLIRITLVVN